MPDIFRQPKGGVINWSGAQDCTENFDTCDVATGYFDLRGWASFADIVETKSASWEPTDPPAVRVLVGMVMPADSALCFRTAGRRTAPNLRLRNQRHRKGSHG